MLFTTVYKSEEIHMYVGDLQYLYICLRIRIILNVDEEIYCVIILSKYWNFESFFTLYNIAFKKWLIIYYCDTEW